MKIVVINGKSESGDDYGPWLFTSKPNDKQLRNFLQQMCPGDFPGDDEEAGPGMFGSYVHVDIHEVNVDDPKFYG